jgi:hypothetical protein
MLARSGFSAFEDGDLPAQAVRLALLTEREAAKQVSVRDYCLRTEDPEPRLRDELCAAVGSTGPVLRSNMPPATSYGPLACECRGCCAALQFRRPVRSSTYKHATSSLPAGRKSGLRFPAGSLACVLPCSAGGHEAPSVT